MTHGEYGYHDSLVINSIDYAMLMVDTARPLPRKRESKRLRFANASVRVLSNIDYEFIDFLYQLDITIFYKIAILLLCLLSEFYWVHAMRFKKSLTDSSSA